MPELPFELAAAYAVARIIPRDKLLVSVYAKDGTSVLRLMGPGLKVELQKWVYDRRRAADQVCVYNWKLTSRYLQKQMALPDRDRELLPLAPKGFALLIRMLMQPETYDP